MDVESTLWTHHQLKMTMAPANMTNGQNMCPPPAGLLSGKANVGTAGIFERFSETRRGPMLLRW